MSKNKIPVLEIFGPTIQGEGMVVGQKTMFVRTAGCDYSCSWCDSAFTWDGSAKNDIKRMDPSEIVERLIEIGGKNFTHVTISGGNPALLSQLDLLIDLLHQNDLQVAVETQGTKYQEWFLKIDQLTISPKPPSSNMETNYEKLDIIIEKLIKKNRLLSTSLKVVIFNQEDLQYATMIHERYPTVPFYLQVGNPIIIEEDRELLVSKLLVKYEWLINEVLSNPKLNNAKVLPQLHTLVWGNKRGV
ncbi:7-carboxy-7-deazaguanine synthase QueE [Bacillus carboniphilus]|uniref:7-carboxy-7-deazaguanine synthase n=1 Tax=Bacillus carboniphilus TaxID=86663 RepID=A0ABY9JUR0_9BACI|nr:7-carboxy-7-deazaguanine synthase QueE [Bacillus carboniphilus]WLR43149.1 7-carboxy-7-deazaguanine synthase QueE [Bacillus carboniphilus]